MTSLKLRITDSYSSIISLMCSSFSLTFFSSFSISFSCLIMRFLLKLSSRPLELCLIQTSDLLMCFSSMTSISQFRTTSLSASHMSASRVAIYCSSLAGFVRISVSFSSLSSEQQGLTVARLLLRANPFRISWMSCAGALDCSLARLVCRPLCFSSNDLTAWLLLGWYAGGGEEASLPIHCSSLSSGFFLNPEPSFLVREQLSHCEMELPSLIVLFLRLLAADFCWLMAGFIIITPDYKPDNVQSIVMLGSSTPDGLAPIDTNWLLAFIITIPCLSMLWGVANLVVLLRFIPEGESSEKMERVFEVVRKLTRGAVDMVKLNLMVGFVAAVAFVLIIMGAVEHFDSFHFSLAFLVGALNAVLVAAGSALISCYVKAKIINFARFSLFDAFDSAKRAANFHSYFFIGETALIIGLFLVLYQRSHEQQMKKPEEIIRIAKTLVYFSFGMATVAIGSRIINSIYAKGADLSVDTLSAYDDKLRRDYKHPALIAKSLGEILNKSVCSVLDSLVFMSAGITVAIYAAAYNIIGTDQEGQIVFDFAINNIYLPALSFLFSLFFNLIFNIALGLAMRPSSGEAVRTTLNLHRYATAFFLVGFQALAAYLCLPAQFMVDQIGDSLRKPYHAYLSILFGLLVCTFVATVAEIIATHPFFINFLSTSCKTGAATTLISGLSFGYMFTAIPVVFITGTLFLVDYWLGSYGIGLAVIGFLALLPHYLHGSLLYSYLENSSYISYITQLDETVTQSLLDAAKTRKDLQPHINTFLYGLICYFGFEIVLVFINSSSFQGSTSLRSPVIFLGLLLGAMFPYFFQAMLVRSIHRNYPAIIFDIRMQIDQVPGMAAGNMDPDFVRTSSLFGFQCLTSIALFTPLLVGPIVLVGIAGGPELVTGFLAGVVISGVQAGASSAMSGCGWATVKKEIGFGNIRDEEGNPIKADSEWSRAADVGYSVGQPLRDCIGLSLPLMLAFWGLQSFAFAPMYASIHS